MLFSRNIASRPTFPRHLPVGLSFWLREKPPHPWPQRRNASTDNAGRGQKSKALPSHAMGIPAPPGMSPCWKPHIPSPTKPGFARAVPSCRLPRHWVPMIWASCSSRAEHQRCSPCHPTVSVWKKNRAFPAPFSPAVPRLQTSTLFAIISRASRGDN